MKVLMCLLYQKEILSCRYELKIISIKSIYVNNLQKIVQSLKNEVADFDMI